MTMRLNGKVQTSRRGERVTTLSGRKGRIIKLRLSGDYKHEVYVRWDNGDEFWIRESHVYLVE